MEAVSVSYDNNVLVGFDKNDDAGVYKLNDQIALVQTVDFLTPIVDDPFIFGQIAASNALSDVYAMGGKPVTAMNIVAFPVNKFSLDILGEILKGGQSILNKASVQLLGGHSVEDDELKYGLSVTGLIHPGKIIQNTGLKDGDVIVLTKPLGTGIIGTSVKAGMIDESTIEPFVKSMIKLNKQTAEIAQKYNINACTDVTGFGLAGHLKEMLQSDSLEIIINSDKLPVLPGVKTNSGMGMLPAGLYRNKKFVDDLCLIDSSIDQYLVDVVFDPQTSGGLIFSLPEKIAELLMKDLLSVGEDASIIGKVISSDKQKIKLI